MPLIVLVLIANLIVAVGPAAAATQTQTAPVSLTGGTNTSIAYDVTAACDACVPDDFAQLVTGHSGWSFAFGANVHSVVSRLDWTSAGSVAVAYDDTLLRQGETLALNDTLTTTSGTITASGSITGSYGLFADPSGGTDFQPTNQVKSFAKSLTWTFSCVVPLPGESPRSCTSGTQTVDIDSYTLFTVPFVDPIDLNIDFNVGVALVASVSSDGVVTARKIDVTGGSGSQSANLEWAGSSPSTIADAANLACTQPAGNEVNYHLTGIAADSPTQSLAARTGIGAKVVASPAIGPDVTVYDLGEFGSIDNPAADISFGLTGPDASVVLGTLQKNNVPPTADAGGGATHTYAGDQGSPITFDGSHSSSVCGFPTLRWDFSDGGVAFGANPQHTFQGSGVYSGMLTATDATGLTSTSTFSVAVANLAPVVDAGPDTTAAWGRQVAFNGSAVDPGSDDQSTLTYSWAFGDGSPSATGGPSVSHAYSTPGSYDATLTVCDHLNACSFDTRTVVVRKRTVTIGSIGDTAGTYDTPGARWASLVDEFGSVVTGRTIDFTVDGVAAGSGVTDASGTAQVAWTPLLAGGTYATGAAFSGDSLYEASTPGAGSVTIAKKATTMTYTGTLTGGPNKTVSLSAILKDATGKSLAGRQVTFVLGSQTATAITDLNGVATASMKLTQKNGTYPLTATWVPSGVDATHYVGSSASATFKLQAK